MIYDVSYFGIPKSNIKNILFYALLITDFIYDEIIGMLLLSKICIKLSVNILTVPLLKHLTKMRCL